MVKGSQATRRHHHRSAAVPSRSGSANAKRALRSSEASSRAAVPRPGKAALRHGASIRSRSSLQALNPPPDRQSTLSLRNRQPVRHVDLRLLRRVVQALLRQTWPDGSSDLAIYLVAEPEMTRLNETFLRHEGSTDVITFDYSDNAGQASRLPPSAVHRTPHGSRRDARPALMHGEIFVCLDEAVNQARRFRATWQSELVRYVVHGVLHLLGHEDLHSRPRRMMKEAEDTLVHQLACQFDFGRLCPEC